MFNNTLFVARTLSKLTLLSACFMPLMAIAIWLFWDSLAIYAAGNLHYKYDLQGMSLGSKGVGFLISISAALVQSYGLLGLKQTFDAASNGHTFSDDSLIGFRRFAWVTLAMVPIGVIQNTLFIIVYSLSDPSHMGTLDISLGSNEAKSLFIGVLLVFVAHVFAEGKAAKDENDTFL